jgi:hypothetical protein
LSFFPRQIEANLSGGGTVPRVLNRFYGAQGNFTMDLIDAVPEMFQFAEMVF